MTVFKHELRRGRVSFLLWTAVISVMLAVCILVYPEMASQMDDFSDLFAEMGSFSQAFGMDRLNYGELIGFFGIECGNCLGLGGAFFAALLGISALAKEEKEHTAEFLLTHPISRVSVLLQKLLSVVTRITMMNLIVAAATALSIVAIGETADVGKMALLFLAYYLMQLEIAAVTFGISAFLRRGSLGIGLGFAACMYFLNLLANLIEETKFLKYITPFGYTESADIVANGSLSVSYLCVGMTFAVLGIAAAFWKYTQKDIA